jgi:hypothetical protein
MMLLLKKLAPLLIAVTCIPAPTQGAEAPAPPVPAVHEASQIGMPITVSLRGLFAEAETRLPREMGSGDAWKPVSDGSLLRLRYTVRRGPLDLSLTGPSVRASTEVAYSFWVKRVAFPVIVVGCGTGKEPPRRASWSADARLHRARVAASGRQPSALRAH